MENLVRFTSEGPSVIPGLKPLKHSLTFAGLGASRRALKGTTHDEPRENYSQGSSFPSFARDYLSLKYAAS